MLDQGRTWLSQAGAGEKVALFVAGYAIAAVATMAILVVMIAALPATYFRDGAGGPPRRRGVADLAVRVVKNALGVVLIALGLLLSLPLVPGQGVLTMLVGLILVDLPGKRRLEQRLVARPRVLDTMNRLRAWLGRPPLVR